MMEKVWNNGFVHNQTAHLRVAVNPSGYPSSLLWGSSHFQRSIEIYRDLAIGPARPQSPWFPRYWLGSDGSHPALSSSPSLGW